MSHLSSPPLTEAQIEARRSKARRSTGPKTVAGKSRSRLNALQHGGYSTGLAWSDAALRALGEDPEEFQSLRQKLLASEGPPDDPLWAMQLEDLARLSWRRRRLERAWEVLGERQAQANEPAALLALSPGGIQLMKQLDAADRAIDRKTRLLLRLREAGDRHRRELESSARRSVRQKLDQGFDEDVPTEEELARQEAELLRLKEQDARHERLMDPLMADFDPDRNNPETAERTEEVAEKKGSGIAIVYLTSPRRGD